MLLMLVPLIRRFFVGFHSDMRESAGGFKLNQSSDRGKRSARGNATVHSIEWNLCGCACKRRVTRGAAFGFRNHKELFSETASRNLP